MPIRTCPRCGYSTSVKSHMKKHFERKIQCSPILADLTTEKCIELVFKGNINIQINHDTDTMKMSDNSIEDEKEVYSCDYCNKQFNHRQSRYRHQNKCKHRIIVQRSVDKEEDTVEKLKEKIELLKEQHRQEISQLITKIGDRTTTHIENTHNVCVNVTVNNFGNENTDYITQDLISKLLKVPYAALPKMVSHLHLNSKHPENQNVRITNKKLPYISIYRDNRWILEHKKEILNALLDQSYDIISDEYDEKGVMYLTPEQANRFIDFQNEYECESATVKKDLLKEVELRILNAS